VKTWPGACFANDTQASTKGTHMPSVKDYCNLEPVTAKREFGLIDAASLMRDQHVGCVVVVERTSGGGHRPVGILTDRDIVVGILAQTDRQLHLVRVDDVMTHNPALAKDTDDLSDTLMTMRAKGIRRMPVVSAAGELVGVLSFDDVLEYVSDEMTDLARLVGRERQHERRVRP
jgi:predicted transcriptional regulator